MAATFLRTVSSKIAENLDLALTEVLKTPAVYGLEICYLRFTAWAFRATPALDFQDALYAVGINGLVLSSALLILLLPLENLVKLYVHLMCGFIVLLAGSISGVYVHEELLLFHGGPVIGNVPEEDPVYPYVADLFPNLVEILGWNGGAGTAPVFLEEFLEGLLPCQLRLPIRSLARTMVHFFCYWTLSAAMSWTLGIKAFPFNRFLAIYIVPAVVWLATWHEGALVWSHWACSQIVAATACFYLAAQFSRLLNSGQDFLRLCRAFIDVNGVLGAGLELIFKLVSPGQLVLFWLFQFLFELRSVFSQASDGGDVGDHAWYVGCLVAMSKVCCSPLSLVASCLVVSMATNVVITLLSVYLTSCKSHAPPSSEVQSGVTEGLTMFLLSLQTGLIDMEMPDRVGTLCVVLFVVAAGLFQTILEVTHPVLLALSASSRNRWSHLKVLLLCLVIFCVPAYMSHLLLGTVELDLWTMVIVSSSLLTSIQVLGHLVHYCLYLYDAFRTEPLESLDDIVYYLKSFVHSLELIAALFVVGAGLKEAWVGQWTFLNTVVLGVHCYFNIWTRVKFGWKSFILRQAASIRIQTLCDATPAQLRAHADVCSICYSDMLLSAKMTPCGHFFHGSCLKKWLFVEDNCPMCSSVIIQEHQRNEEVANADPVEEIVDFDDQEVGD